MSALFPSKKRTSLRRLLQDRRLQGHTTKRTWTYLYPSSFRQRTRVYAREPFDEESEQFQDKTLQLLIPNSKRLGGYTKMGVFFLQKSTHHSKIPRSAIWFHSRKYSDDACSYSTMPEGTRRGFQSSTMKCSGACRCGTHGIPRKEGRRSSLTMILPM